MLHEQTPPTFIVGHQEALPLSITVMLPNEAEELLPNDSLPEFKDKERITISNHIYITAKQGKKYVIEQSCNLSFSQGVQGLTYYSGLASGLLASSYSYSVKTINPPPNITVALHIHSK
jgi:hypothetical protein